MTWRTVSLAVWTALAVAVVGAQIVAVASRGRLPTVEALARAATAGTVRRGVIVLGWMWLGWHTFGR